MTEQRVAEIVIPNSTVTKIIDDLTFTNGPGVHFVIVGVAEGKRPSMMTTLPPDSLHELFKWLLDRKDDVEIERLNMEDDSFKKGH